MDMQDLNVDTERKNCDGRLIMNQNHLNVAKSIRNKSKTL